MKAFYAILTFHNTAPFCCKGLEGLAKGVGGLSKARVFKDGVKPLEFDIKK